MRIQRLRLLKLALFASTLTPVFLLAPTPVLLPKRCVTCVTSSAVYAVSHVDKTLGAGWTSCAPPERFSAVQSGLRNTSHGTTALSFSSHAATNMAARSARKACRRRPAPGHLVDSGVPSEAPSFGSLQREIAIVHGRLLLAAAFDALFGSKELIAADAAVAIAVAVARLPFAGSMFSSIFYDQNTIGVRFRNSQLKS